MLLPSTRAPLSLIKYRGATPSEELTKFTMDAADDLTKLFVAINENTNKLSELQSVTYAENRALVDMIAELEAQIKEKNEIIAGNAITSKYIIPKDIDTVGLDNPANLSIEYQQVIPSNNMYTPKLYIYDSVSQKNLIPDNVKNNIVIEQTVLDNLDITINNEDVISTDNKVEYALDGNLTTCWQRKVEVPEELNAQSVELKVTFPIPYETVSNRTINTIGITTHPIRGIDIVNIEVKSGDQWLQIEEFTNHPLFVDGVIPNAHPLRFYFNDITALEVRVTIRQNKMLTENNKDIFYIGAYAIDVGYTELSNRTSEFSAVVSLGSSDSVSIKEINAIFDNPSTATGAFNYQLYYIALDDSITFVSSSLPVSIPSNKILLMCTITAQTNVIPAISYIQVKYEPVI